MLDRWELTVAELAVLDLAADTLDDIAELAAAVETDGRTVPGSTGQTRVHPAVAEIRQQRATLARLIGSLALPDPDGNAIRTSEQLAASAAGRTRWTRDRRLGVVD